MAGLRLGPDAASRNVESEVPDPDSVFGCYSRVLAFRATSAALRRGGMTRLESGAADVLAWTREAAAERLLVLVSFVGEPRQFDLGRLAGGPWQARVGTHVTPAEVGADGTMELRGDEAVVLEAPGA